MDWIDTLFQVIDLRSFSNLWFWIALAVLWSSASYWVLGIPYDIIQRAGRQGGQAEADLRDVVRVNVNRILYIVRTSGLVLAGVVVFALTTLAVLAFWYDVEFAQALFLLGLPGSIVGLLSIATARAIEAEDPETPQLIKRLMRHRFWTQVVGMLSIFVTAMYGMYQNLDYRFIY